MSGQEQKFGGVTLDGVLAQRVNHEPLIFRGLTSSELNFLFLVSMVVWLPVCLIFGLLFYTPTMMIGVAFALAIATVFFGSSIFQKIKRNRPDGYYTQKIALTLERLKLKRSGFDMPDGVMALGRTPHFQNLRR